MSGVDASILRVAIVLKCTFRVRFGFQQATFAMGGVMRAVGFVEDALVITRLLNNRCSRSADVVDLRS